MRWRRPSRIAGIGCVLVAILVPIWSPEGVEGIPKTKSVLASPSVPAPPTAPKPRGPCELPPIDVKGTADALLGNRYRLARFPAYTLPANPRWDENPARDNNWAFNFHTLRFVEALWRAYDATHDRRYLDRSEFIIRDWYRDNPRSHPASRWAWNDHSTAWRAIVYACALKRLPGRPWLHAAASLHARTLIDERFYKKHGNHALNQSIGLLALGCVMRQETWKTLAIKRIDKLVVESVDDQGVTNEQSIGYQYYNFARYSVAIEHMRACRAEPSVALTSRVSHMPGFMRWGTLPNGEWELVGDTVKGGYNPGTRPSGLYAVYTAGFAFLRSGWGIERALRDETAICVRFGPRMIHHGHRDAASLTLYANGDRILFDPGMFHFGTDPWRDWFRSGPAHNTIEVSGSPMRESGETELIAERHEPGFDFLALRHRKIAGVDHLRRILYSRRLGVVLVEDDVRASSPRTVRQWWHLHPEARPAFSTDGFFTGRRGSNANALVVQLDGDASQGVVRGDVNPIQGWVSFDYGQRVPAPAVSVMKTGTRVRFFTLIALSPSGARTFSVRSFTPRPVGFDLVLRLGGMTERFVVRGAEGFERTV
jgi:hypothetical protein